MKIRILANRAGKMARIESQRALPLLRSRGFINQPLFGIVVLKDLKTKILNGFLRMINVILGYLKF